MCLTIPKKVLSINGSEVEVELPDGDRQKIKTIVTLAIGDFVMTHQNIAIEKIEKEVADLMLLELKALLQRKEVE